ncbi:zinc finger protein 180-like [Conger conger]|uniref:zinc finger protein 180-like n=1 Tax=Conger conger TaxID=82655 RepID=UPI002A5B0928|nr:zinc finger protein 180-like [Conger conger]
METLSIAEGEFGATLPSIEECKLSSVSCPPSQRVVDSAKLTDTNSQSEFITDCIKPLSPTSSGEDIEAEYLMDCTDYTGLNIRANFEETTEWKTGYSLSRVQKDMLTNLKEEEEEDGERQSVKIEMAVVKDEEGLWKEEVNEREKHGEGRVTNEAAQTHKLVKNGVKSEHGQQEGEELANLVTTCLLKQPRVLIHRLEIGRNSVPVSSPACPLACKRDQAVRSTWRQHEFFPLRGNGSAVRKGQVVTQKRKLIGQFRPLKLLPSSPRKGICADASPISPVITPRNQNTEQAAEMSSQVFACSQCPFVHAEEVNLHQHIAKVHPEELSRTVGSQQPSSSTHQHPTPPKTLPTPTQSHPLTPGAHTCSQCGTSFKSKSLLTTHKNVHKREGTYQCSRCGKSFIQLGNLKQHQRTHTGERPYQCSQCDKSFALLGNLRQHQRTHTGERPYQCSQCDKSFTKADKLNAHLRIHTGERPYYCSQCGKSFVRADLLKVHQQTHTGERPYHCSQCGKSFANSRNLKEHQRTHTGVRPYHCSQCGKSFAHSSTLKQHQRIHSRERHITSLASVTHSISP